VKPAQLKAFPLGLGLLGNGGSSGVQDELTVASFAEVALLTGVNEAIFDGADRSALRTGWRVHTSFKHSHYLNASTVLAHHL